MQELASRGEKPDRDVIPLIVAGLRDQRGLAAMLSHAPRIDGLVELLPAYKAFRPGIPDDFIDCYLDQIGRRSISIECICSENHSVRAINYNQDYVQRTELVELDRIADVSIESLAQSIASRYSTESSIMFTGSDSDYKPDENERIFLVPSKPAAIPGSLKKNLIIVISGRNRID